MSAPSKSVSMKTEKSKSIKGDDGSNQPQPPQQSKKSMLVQELEKQRAAQQLAEEQRLAALKQAEEEEKKKNLQQMDNASNKEKVRDLLAWIRSVPLSESCVKRIDRAFSDGALLAELIHYYCPWMVNKREYLRWNSKYNKRGNWEALNMKVFPKLGFRLNQRQINNILNPYTCGKFQKDCLRGIFIYKLLVRVRDILAETNPQVFDYRKEKAKEKEEKAGKDKDNCKPPITRKKKKLVNMLDQPPVSRVEWLLESGFYDREEATPQQRPPACGCKTTVNRKKKVEEEEGNDTGCGGLSFNFRPNSSSNGMANYSFDCNACISNFNLRPTMSYASPIMSCVHSCIEF